MISIIIPVYRAEGHLSNCIDTILGQDFSDLELILVDDGSPDGSGAICDRYAAQDHRVRVIHKTNGGVSSARNAGMEVAQGEYLLFVDSDDYVEPDYASSLLAAMEAHSDCGHVWCCFQTVTGYQKEDAAPNMAAEKPYLRFDRAQIMDLHRLWLDASPCNKLYRTSMLREKGIRFPEDLSLGEDWLFNQAYLDAVPSTEIVVVTKPLYNYVRNGKESLDEGYRPDMLEIYRRLNSACRQYLERWGVSREQMQIFYDSEFYSYEKVLRNTLRAPDRPRREAWAWNTALMKSQEFQEALRRRQCFVHPLYLRAYRMGDYRLVALLSWIQKKKARFGGR